MKQLTILFALLAMFTACKKEKAPPPDYTMLTGNWKGLHQYATFGGATTSDSFTFEADSNYSRIFSGDVGESGKYSIKKLDGAIMELRLSPGGGGGLIDGSYVVTVMLLNRNKVLIHDRNLAGHEFIRD